MINPYRWIWRNPFITTAILQYADFLSSWYDIAHGATEQNPIVVASGGLFGTWNLSVKLFIIPSSMIVIHYLVKIPKVNEKKRFIRMGRTTLLYYFIVLASNIGWIFI